MDILIGRSLLQNQQLFSEAYIREIRVQSKSLDTVLACRQTLRDWSEEYSDLSKPSVAASFVTQALSALGISYAPVADARGFRIRGTCDSEDAVGLCLIVSDENVGRSTKGRHYQVQLIKQLRDEKLTWGIITNGAQWRLCNARSSAPYEVYFEANLNDLLASSDSLLTPNEYSQFGAFYHFFGREAWLVNASGSDKQIGLDGILAASEKRTEAIERHLKGRIEKLLQNLCLGFVQDEAAEEYTREKLDTIYKNSIYLLYRLLFLFYAEARNLLPVSQEEYRAVSLAALTEKARRHQEEGIPHDDDPHSYWRSLRNLFGYVDFGANSYGINAYNGGLFNDEEKPYLKDHNIANDFLAPAIYELGFEKTKAGIVPIDYRDLSVRHLGTLYEGLLEFKLNIVKSEQHVIRESGGKKQFLPLSVAAQTSPIKKSETILEIGDVYFADDKGERKSSGSYYTPEDVVQYIVLNTVAPKLVEHRATLDATIQELSKERAIAPTEEEKLQIGAFADAKALEAINRDLLSLRVLDPAMGSGHFLVAAGQTITNFIVETINATDWPNDSISTDPLVWKRRVVERCLYGVDKNELARELAKLSLWISSASAGKPLTFLDHHLKCGNSLCGAPLNRLSQLPLAKSKTDSDLFSDYHQRIINDLAERFRKINASDSDRIEDVKRKTEAHRAVHVFGQRITDIANVWLATLFDLKGENGKALTNDEYGYLWNIAIQNRQPEAWETFVKGSHILSEARRIATEKEFFHWEVEFPDSVVAGECRFDAVVANPPYVGAKADKAMMTLYTTAPCGDLYAWILEKCLKLTQYYGKIGTVVPLSSMFSQDFASLREIMLVRSGLHYFSSFDIRPDSIFRNGQKVTIMLISSDIGADTRIMSTGLTRWLTSERPILLPSLIFDDISDVAASSGFPRLCDVRLTRVFNRIQNYSQHIKDRSLDFTSKRSMVNSEIRKVYFASAALYFITAMPHQFKSTGIGSLNFANDHDRDVALVVLNSNVCYWLWTAIGDGFHVTLGNLGKMVMPLVQTGDKTLIRLRDDLIFSAEECAVHNSKCGIPITSYDFNKRMDILLDIDDWIVSHVAPDLNLPRGIFAQYKSNSFLRPLDLSALTSGSTETEGVE